MVSTACAMHGNGFCESALPMEHPSSCSQQARARKIRSTWYTTPWLAMPCPALNSHSTPCHATPCQAPTHSAYDFAMPPLRIELHPCTPNTPLGNHRCHDTANEHQAFGEATVGYGGGFNAQSESDSKQQGRLDFQMHHVYLRPSPTQAKPYIGSRQVRILAADRQVPAFNTDGLPSQQRCTIHGNLVQPRQLC